MPKRKRMKDYGSKIPSYIEENYLNRWLNNKETKDDMPMISYLLKAEGNSLIQILIAENELYNGIFHITKFEFVTKEDNSVKLIVKKFDDLHDGKKQDFVGLMEQLPTILEKYQGQLIKEIDTNVNPLLDYEKYPLLILE